MTRWKGTRPADGVAVSTDGFCQGCGRGPTPLNRQQRRAAGRRKGEQPTGIDHTATCPLFSGGGW